MTWARWYILPGILALSFGVGTASGDEAVVVVSPKNPLTILSRYQIADIFLGRANRFPNGEPAAPIDQAEGSTARNEFYDEFTGKSSSQIKAYWSRLIFTGRGKPPSDVASGQELKKMVRNNPNAIGYLSRDLIDDSVKVLEVQ